MAKTKQIKTAINILGGVVFLPLAFVCSLACFVELSAVSWLAYPQLLVLLGAVVCLILYSLLPQESLSYVTGHEIVHALTSILFGGQLLALFISHRRGSVRVSKSNIVVSLAPYAVPFYAALVGFFYYGLSVIMPTAHLVPLALFLLGYTLTHHAFFTLRYLAVGQRDIKEHGAIISYVLIVAAYSVILVALLGMFVHTISITHFGTNIGAVTQVLFGKKH